MARSNGFVLGLAAVIAFSLTLPMVRLALPYFGVAWLSFGRTAIAGGIALLILALLRDRFPREHMWGLVVASLSGMVAYPVLTSIGLQHSPAVHAVVIAGFSPALTAIFATLRGGERPPVLFWFSCAAGAVSVILFALTKGAGHLQADDLYFLLATTICAYGYAEGAIAARAIGGWRVVFWGQALILPVTVPLFFWSNLHQTGLQPVTSILPWIALCHLIFMSALISFVLWYMGLARGGTARISQLQLLQLPLSCIWCFFLLGEQIDRTTMLAAGAVVASVLSTVLTRRRKALLALPPQGIAAAVS